MVKPAAILGIGLILLIVILSFVAYVQVAVLFFAVITLSLVFWAMLTHIRSPRQLWIELPASEQPDANVPSLVIQGKQFKSTRSTVISAQVKLANVALALLAGTLLITIATLYIVLANTNFSRPIDNSTGLYFVFYFLAYFSVLPLYIAGRFLRECKLLARAAVTVGLIQQHIRGGLCGRQIRFEFRGLGEAYFGDTTVNLWASDSDNAVLVFFRCEYPAYNKAAPSLFFHRVYISEE